jgi:hypothetical protein
LKMEAVCSFVTLVFDQKTTLRNNLEEPWRWRQHVHPKP